MNADHKLACPHVMGGSKVVGSVRDGQKTKGLNLASGGVEGYLTWICIRTTAFPRLGYNGS
jgi:hypothetical protein